MEKKVKVKNLISSRVVFSSPDLRFRAVWEKKGAVKAIPFEILEESIYDPGVEALFTEGILGIDDMEVKIALGLEPEDAVEPVNIIALSEADMKRYLTVMPLFEFRQKVKEIPREQLIEMARYAIANKITDFDKSEILLEITDINIINSIKLNRENELTD